MPTISNRTIGPTLRRPRSPVPSRLGWRNPPGRYGALLASLLLAGCSRMPTVTPEDSNHAREVLTETLEAWKRGQPATLAKRQPAIRFVDDDWSAGCQLVDFRVEQADAVIRPFAGVKVHMTLRNRAGKTFERQAEYQISLTPSLSVLRSDL